MCRAAANKHTQGAAVKLSEPELLHSLKEVPLGKYKACLLDQVLGIPLGMLSASAAPDEVHDVCELHQLVCL